MFLKNLKLLMPAVFLKAIRKIFQIKVLLFPSLKLHTAESFNFRGLQLRSRQREQSNKRVSLETLS